MKKDVGNDLVKSGVSTVIPEIPSLPVDSSPSLDLGLIKGNHVLENLKPLVPTESHKAIFFSGFNVCNPVGSLLENVDLTLFEPSLGGLGFVSLVKPNLFKNGYFL